jgi:phosphopentomutase
MKRAIIIVIDSMGIGAMPDCKEYNDVFECNTLGNVADFCNGLNLPNLQNLGLANIKKFNHLSSIPNPLGQYGIMAEKSKGKDTTTGHWELMGLVLDKPFATFPQGFDNDLIHKFIEKTQCTAVLGNYPASGTRIIEDLNDEHQKTKYPIIYTSADSVFQIACDIDLIPLEKLYKWCEIARKILDDGKYNISRVIARPYRVINAKPTRISKDRKDYSIIPPKPTLLNELQNKGKKVIAIGKIEDIFSKSGITHAIHTASNKEGLEITLKAIKDELDLEKIKLRKTSSKEALIFTNLVDTDMLYGHRNDAKGYGMALKEIDVYLGEILENLQDEDLLVITADHGCDPTVEGTDHTREYVPVIFYHKNIESKNLGLLNGFDNVTNYVKTWFEDVKK